MKHWSYYRRLEAYKCTTTDRLVYYVHNGFLICAMSFYLKKCVPWETLTEYYNLTANAKGEY